jgi:hypothetical protein
MKSTEQRTAAELQEGLSGIEEYWPWPAADPEYPRLENYIVLAKKGESIRASIELSKQTIKMGVATNGESGPGIEMEAFLLLGTYRFILGGEVRSVSKVYALCAGQGGIEEEKRDKKVADERLRMDYKRLKEAGIEIEDRYFE